MLKRILKSISESKNNNSVLYLALLCLIYFFITSNYLSPSINPQSYIDSSGKIYIEISDKDGFTIVKSLPNSKELVSIQNKYGIKESLKSGGRLIVGNNGDVQLTRISGLKSISLGVAIGINSAGANDLKAIPGIGEKLAARIINYRDLNGKSTSLEELDNVEGIGEKKLANIKRLANLD
jgi:competence ComEA-like helix-hairpin-helix protein